MNENQPERHENFLTLQILQTLCVMLMTFFLQPVSRKHFIVSWYLSSLLTLRSHFPSLLNLRSFLSSPLTLPSNLPSLPFLPYPPISLGDERNELCGDDIFILLLVFVLLFIENISKHDEWRGRNGWGSHQNTVENRYNKLILPYLSFNILPYTTLILSSVFFPAFSPHGKLHGK